MMLLPRTGGFRRDVTKLRQTKGFYIEFDYTFIRNGKWFANKCAVIVCSNESKSKANGALVRAQPNWGAK
jgi:hypothetical protein